MRHKQALRRKIAEYYEQGGVFGMMVKFVCQISVHFITAHSGLQSKRKIVLSWDILVFAPFVDIYFLDKWIWLHIILWFK